MTRSSISKFLFGKPLDPTKLETRKHIALVTFFAWIGLGADGISSAAYGPEEAFAALGAHPQLGIFLAIATGVTVFLIAFAYMQVIELLPNGGGGYKVASTLLGPYAGLVAGSALIIDYVLTIAISLASGVDSIFSIVPQDWHFIKLPAEWGLVFLLTYLNLRGAKESIKVLMPIFLGFVITHLAIIVYGIAFHAEGLGEVIPEAITETTRTAQSMGWFALLALFFKAFSMGGGTYTGLEAVSNSMHNLAEPKVKTGKSTMFCVALSLSVMATGIILLYLLWDVIRIPGQTMNATAFSIITEDWHIGETNISYPVVMVLMLFTAGLLFVAANTGFIAGPAVLANMAVDRWMPSLFSALSSRLVTKNGILLMGCAAIIALGITEGKVDLLVVLYSVNVFLTFTLSLAGLTRLRWQQRKQSIRKLILPVLALLVCAAILVTTILEKFMYGAWITIVVTSLLVLCGHVIRRHYYRVYKSIRQKERSVARTLREAYKPKIISPALDSKKSTAVFILTENSASGVMMFKWVQKTFGNIFHNIIFASVGEIDTEEFSNDSKWQKLRKETKKVLKYCENFCHGKGLASTYYHAFGTDVVEKLTTLTDRIVEDFPNSLFFGSKLISDNETIFTQLLHNQSAYIMQRRLHNKGHTMIIIPIKLDE